MKRGFFGTLMVVAVVAAAAGWWFRAELGEWLGRLGMPLSVRTGSKLRPDPGRYEVLKQEAERWRKKLAGDYRAARTPAEHEAVLREARTFLESLLPDMMRCWIGTPWDFNGTSDRPGEGKIACGYFVSTVLRDAGFRVDRYKLARQPSQNILGTFLPQDEMVLRVGVPYETYAAELRGFEPGIRIVGLDTHVGFIVSRPEGFHFVHSSGSQPWCVVEETEEGAEVLKRSNYRVAGCLTADREVVRKWVTGTAWTVRE